MNGATLFLGLAMLATSGYAQAQGQCGCQPQPTIIKLSCGGGANRPIQSPPPFYGHPPPPPPAPAPEPTEAPVFEMTTPGNWEEPEATTKAWGFKPRPPAGAPAPPPAGAPAPPPAGTPSPPGHAPDYTTASPLKPKFDENWCKTDSDGYLINEPPGGFPEGFRMKRVPCTPGGPCLPQISLDEKSQVRPPPSWNGLFDTLPFALVPGTPTYNMVQCWPVPIEVKSGQSTTYDIITAHERNNLINPMAN